MNEEIINSRWSLTRKELKSFQQWFFKQNKLTQDKIQDLINIYDLSFEDLNKKISKLEREKLSRRIDEWIELGIYTGYFKYRVEELLNNLTYRNLLEILIYEIYLEEEKNTLDEIKILFSSVSLDCYNQGLTDLNKKKVKKVPSILDKAIFETLIDGSMLEDYLNALYLTNAQEIQKQYLISKQQGKSIDVYSDLMKRTFEKQRNRLISISNGKISGALDKYTIALGNMAYIEAGGNDNQKVKFISDLCDNVTEMCSYMDGMIFNTKNRNIFKRPIGKTQKDLVLQNIDIQGLVVGLNQPPINEHFHWCHSTLTYFIDKSSDELRQEIFDKEGNEFFNENIIDKYNKLDKQKEHMMIFDINTGKQLGKTITGNSNTVNPDLKTLIKIKTSPKNSLLIVHNHPNNSSFSFADIETFNRYNSIGCLGVVSDKYIYFLSSKNSDKIILTKNEMKLLSERRNKLIQNFKSKGYEDFVERAHLVNKQLFKEIGWDYERIENIHR